MALARKDISTLWDRDMRTAIDENFKELYSEYTQAGLDAKDARNKAEQAVADSLEAKQTANVTREEMLAIIREQTQNGDLAPEIAQARQGEQTLGDNLNSIKSNLAQTKTYAVETVSHKVDRNINVLFHDDDGDARIMSILKEKIFDPEGVPCSVCVNTSTVGNPGKVTWEDLSLLKNSGWTVFSHGHEHLNALNTPPDVIDNDYATARKILNERGFSGDILAYPYGAVNEDVQQIARKNHVAAFSTYGLAYNTMPLNTFYLYRFGGPPVRSLQEAKDYLDNAPDGALVVFMGHVVEPEYDFQSTIDDYRALIQYCKTKGYEIINTEEAIKRKANVLDVGRRDNKYFKVGRDGSFYMSDFNDHSVELSTPIDYYPIGTSRTYFSFDDAVTKGFPGQFAGSQVTPSAGTLITSRIRHDFYSNSEHASHQLYVGATNNNVFKRRWNVSTGSWTDFEVVLREIKEYPYHYVETQMNVFNASTPLTSFPARQIHTFYYNSANQTGFPVYAGIVTTYRMNSDTWNRQEVRGVDEKTVWSRYWTGTTWSAWERPTQLLAGMQRTVATTTVPAHSTLDIVTDLSSVKMAHSMIAKPQTAVENGIIWNCYAPQDGRGVIRLANITGSSISMAERVWVVDRLTHN